MCVCVCVCARARLPMAAGWVVGRGSHSTSSQVTASDLKTEDCFFQEILGNAMGTHAASFIASLHVEGLKTLLLASSTVPPPVKQKSVIDISPCGQGPKNSVIDISPYGQGPQTSFIDISPLWTGTLDQCH